MRINQQQMQRIAHLVLDKWKKNNVVTLKEDESKVIARAMKAIADDYQKEIDLEREVHKMLEQLERTNSGEFSRHKMYTMLKQKLAKEKKVIL